ncbi:FG-GAP-like repeat-containing protein [Chitinophaga sp. OAE865]|uniref:FG-GAP repeat domain-containing protein n=1 Tax=Chitinophaga sp. OAE865 TaxID=2817898 RepID=UPI001AE465B0
MKLLFLLPVLLLVQNKALKDGKGLPQLEPGFKIEANGKPIVLDMGHAAPFVIDYDGDGIKDLVVGEFGEGRARIYLNKGTNKAPKFNDFTYLQAGGEDAKVPPFCCIGFDPSFADLNGDGITDVISGQFSGGFINFFEGTGKHPLQFKKGVKLAQPELEHELAPGEYTWFMRTANLIDFDSDGDYDLVWGNAKGDVMYTENIGTKTAYKFAKTVPLNTEGKHMVVNSKSDPLPVDWDGDGIIDLLVGTESGGIKFFRGKAKNSKDFYPGVSVWPTGEKEPYPGYRVRLATNDWNEDGKLDLLVGNCEEAMIDGERATIGNVYVFLRK